MAHATDFGLDLIELGDAFQPFAGNPRTVTFEDFTQLSPRVGPTIGDTERITAFARRLREPVLAGISIDLQDAIEAVQERLGMPAAATGRVKINNARRV